MMGARPNRRKEPKPPLRAPRDPWWSSPLAQRLGLVAFYTMLGLIVYWPALGGEFLWDDDTVLTQNLVLKPGGLYRAWFTTDAHNYWPVTWTSFWLEHHLWGLRPAPYHVVNLLLHVGCAVMVAGIAARLRIAGAAWIGLVFLLHPINVETAAWIAQRKTLLSAVFSCSALLAYLHWRENSDRRWYFWSIVAFALAMLSKGAAVGLPLVMGGIAVWQAGSWRKANLRGLTPHVGIAVCMAIVEIWFQYQRAMGGQDEIVRDDSLLVRTLGAGWAAWFYTWRVVWPVAPCFVYPRWQIDPQNVLHWLPLVALLGVAGAAWRWRRNDGGATLLAGFCYLAMLGPHLGFLNIYFMRYSLVADHYQYLAMPAMLLWLAAGLHAALRRWQPTASGAIRGVASRRALWGVAGLLLLGLGGHSWQQCWAYRDNGTLFRDTLRKNPTCWMALANLAVFHQRRNELELAETLIRRSLEMQPFHPEGYSALGFILRLRGDTAGAEQAYDQALQQHPSLLEAHLNRAELLLATGRPQEAIQSAQQYLTASHGRPNAQLINVLARALAESGRLAEAEQQYRMAIRIDPHDAGLYNNLAVFLLRQGRFGEATEQLETAAQINPHDADVQRNLTRLRTMLRGGGPR